jgi:hypothetical protein
VAAAATQTTNLYNRLAATLNERGYDFLIVLVVRIQRFCRQALGDLEDQFNALEEGSKSMVAQVMFNWLNLFFSCFFNVVHRQSVLQPSTLQNRQQSHGFDRFHDGGIAHGNGTPLHLLLTVVIKAADHRHPSCKHMGENVYVNRGSSPALGRLVANL